MDTEEILDSDDEDWDNCDEEVVSNETKCLFCDKIFNSPDDALNHCKETHNFNIDNIKNKHRLDCFGYIKMVNYIRKNMVVPENIVSQLAEDAPWMSDIYLLPVLEDDGMLQYDIEEDEAIASGDIAGNVLTDMDKLNMAESRAEQAEIELQRVLKDLNRAREIARQFVMSAPEPQPMVPCLPIGAGASLTDDEDDGYFASYGHFNIHLEMLQDKVRTESYRDAIYKNGELFKDKVVLDIGCGTGILCMFAAKAGARQVIGIDQSDVIYQAMDIIRENGLESTITLIKGKVETTDLPVDKVDIIISEWMGYFLLFESMLDTVLFARNKWLSPDGNILPNRCTMSLVAIDDMDMHSNNIGYWEDVYGFKMSCMKAEVVQEASEKFVSKEKIISSPVVIKELNIETCRFKDLDFLSEFTLTVTHEGNVTALVGYFDIFFNNGCKNQVHFSTSPESPATHWKQTVFFLDKPLVVSTGDEIGGSISVKKDKKDPRSLIVTLTLNGISRTYHMT